MRLDHHYYRRRGFAAMLPGWAQLAMAIGAAIELVRLIIVGVLPALA